MYSKTLTNILKFVFFIVFLFLIFNFSKNYLSLDSFKHLLSGKQIFINKSLLKFDDSSFVKNNIFDRNYLFFDLFAYLNVQYLSLNFFKYYKMLLLFFSFFILFLIIYKRLMGKYITISLIPSSFAAIIIMVSTKFSPEIFNLFFLSCFLYILERNPSEKNKNLYYILPFLSLIWCGFDIWGAFIGISIMLFYLIYRYFDLKEQPEKEEKYLLKMFFISCLITILLFLFYAFIILSPKILFYNFSFYNTFKYDGLLNFNFIFYIYILLYIFIITLNLRGADVGRKSELFKDIFVSFFLFSIGFFNINKIIFFIAFSIPVISYYTYLIFKWDFVWKKQWSEKNLTFIKNIVYIILIPVLLFSGIYFEKNIDKQPIPYQIVQFINTYKLPPNIYHPEKLKNFLGFFLYPDYKLFLENKKNLKENIKSFNLNTFIVEKDSKVVDYLLNENYKISYFDDDYFILINPSLHKQYFKNFSPEKSPITFDIKNFKKIKNELEFFSNFYPSESAFLILAKIYKSKDTNIAIKYLDEKISENPSYFKLYKFLAQLLYEVEDYENAYEILKKIKKKDKEIIDIINKLKFKSF